MESVARIFLLLVLVAVLVALSKDGWRGVKALINAKFATNFSTKA